MGVVHLQRHADIQGAILFIRLKGKVANNEDLDNVHGATVLDWNEVLSLRWSSCL